MKETAGSFERRNAGCRVVPDTTVVTAGSPSRNQVDKAVTADITTSSPNIELDLDAIPACCQPARIQELERTSFRLMPPMLS